MVSFLHSFSQSERTKKADATFERGEYFKALQQYQKIYEKGKIDKETKAYVTFQIAECYRHIGNFKKAEMKYKAAISKKYQNPLVFLYYGQMLRANAKYDLAIEQLKKYLELVPDDKEAQIALKASQLSKEWMMHPTRYEIKNIRDINTKESEFAPALADASERTLYFTTTAKINAYTQINKITGKYYTSIMETYLTKKGDWTEPKPLNDTINSPYDDGVCTFTDNYNTMYFTRCNVVAGQKLGCSIYKATRPADGDWEKTEYVPILSDSISVGHPSISMDGLTLYFSAEIPGKGYGGKDIWKVERKSKSDSWGQPVNLGPEINTEGNEVFPYIRDNGYLYFASDFHPGLGGLDIFRARYDKTYKKWIVENMKFPINSPADDFGITFKKGKEEGFFTSNRKKTEIYHDGELVETIRSRGSDDIYSFVLPPLEFKLIGRAFDNETGEPLKDVKIKIYGSDGTEVTLKTGANGIYKYKLKPGVDYIYVISKKGYLVNKGKVSTVNIEYNKTFTDSVYMAEINKPVEIPNIYYDFGKWTLKEESKKELDKLVDLLKANPNIVIELSSHTDMVGDEISNQILSQKRAQSVVDYLISKGIDPKRLIAKGYGESKPKVITEKLAKKYPQFKAGTVLSEDFINSLKDDKLKELANQLNRRTEFKVVQTDYIPDFDVDLKKFAGRK